MNIWKRLGIALLAVWVLVAVPAAEVWLPASLGDGVQDAAPAMRAALAAMSRGGDLRVPGGSWRLLSAVQIPSNTCVVGEGVASTLIVEGSVGLEFMGSTACIRRLAMTATNAGPVAISYKHATTNISVDDVLFGHRFSIGVDVAPEVSGQGVYELRNLRWNGVLDSGTAIRVGDGIHNVSDVRISGVSGTADTPADMDAWIEVSPKTDTVDIGYATFIKGGVGVRVGANAAGPAAVTGFTLHDSPAIESMTSYGVLLLSANNARVQNISVAQSQGGLGAGAGIRGLMVSGSTLHYNRGDGMTIWPGAESVIFEGNLVADNNTSASTWGFGISVGAGVSKFTLANNRIGNGLLWGGGFQRYCIFVAPGNSSSYGITGNACSGHTAVNGDLVYDGGTGPKKVVSGNY